MGTFLLIVIGLPVCALVWAGAGWLLATIWADLRLKVALGKQADERVRQLAENAVASMRRGY